MIISKLFMLIDGKISIINFIQVTLFVSVAVIIALSVHECCHAVVAYWFGDKTAKSQGRITLNPFRHMNLIGTLMLLIVGFGWANPVIVDSRNFKKPRLGMALTAAAGPVSNLLMSFIFSFLYVFLDIKIVPLFSNVLIENLSELFIYIIIINMSFAIFNLVPFPPLDGSKIIGEMLPLKYRYKYYSLERFSLIFFLVLIALLRFFDFLSIVNINIMNLFFYVSRFILGI